MASSIRGLSRIVRKSWKIALAVVLITSAMAVAKDNGILTTVFGDIVPQIQETLPSVPAEVEVATVVKVVDGDTFTASVNGVEQKVRLIGVDTPESVSSDASKNCEEGIIASDHTKAILPVGSVVYMTKDISDTDKYGRLLRYVWFVDPTTNNADVSTMLNAQLVSDGYAQAKQYPPDVKYATTFTQLGQNAASQGLGVSAKWAA